MKKSHLISLAAAMLALTFSSCGKTPAKTTADSDPEYVLLAYVWAGGGDMLPPADKVTGINYGFGYPNETRNGIYIDNEKRFQDVIDLKKQNPDLKVLLSMGGNSHDGYPELVSTEANRKAFAKDCLRVIKEYGIDGIDFDWEFPASEGGTPDDIDNFQMLMEDIREAIGPDYLLTVAGGASARALKFPELLSVVDYINIMSYDLGWQAPYHHTALYRSDVTGWHSVEESLHEFLDKGVPRDMIVLGMAFYGRGDEGKHFANWTDYKDIKVTDGLEERWDSVGCVPYLADKATGELVIGYENPRSLEIKCQYIKDQGLKGGMYWRTEYENPDQELAHTVARCLLGK